MTCFISSLISFPCESIFSGSSNLSKNKIQKIKYRKVSVP